VECYFFPRRTESGRRERERERERKKQSFGSLINVCDSDGVETGRERERGREREIEKAFLLSASHTSHTDSPVFIRLAYTDTNTNTDTHTHTHKPWHISNNDV